MAVSVSRSRIVHRPWLVAVVGAAFACASPALSAQLLRFTVSARSIAGAQVAEVASGAQVILRLRGADGAEVMARAQEMVARLTELALGGVRPDEIGVRPYGVDAQVVARGMTVVVADAETARASGSTATALAEQWANTLRQLLAAQYTILTPGGPLAVPVGEQRVLHWGGTASAGAAVVSGPPCVTVEVQPASRQIVVSGVATGDGSLKLRLAGHDLAVPIACRKWAARFFEPSAAFITGEDPPDGLRRQAAINAALAASQVEPGAVVGVESTSAEPDGMRIVMEARGEQFFTAKRAVIVQMRRTDAPGREAAQLLVSNYPERVRGIGVVLSDTMIAGEPARLLWHHLNDSDTPLRLSVRLVNGGPGMAVVHCAVAPAGPSADEIGAGHRAMVRFVRDLQQGNGALLRIPPGTAWSMVSTVFRPRQILSGLAGLTVLQGTGVTVEVVAEPCDAPGESCLVALPGDAVGHSPAQTPFTFRASKPLALQHVIGGPWTFLRIGRDAQDNNQGRKLYGEYGVQYQVTLTVRNERDVPARYEIALRGGGGAARGTFVIDGKLVETGLLTGGIETVLGGDSLPAHSERTVRILTIPESGSYYPVTLQVRSARGL